MSAVMPESAAALGRRAAVAATPAANPPRPAPWPAPPVGAAPLDPNPTEHTGPALPTESAAERLEQSRARLRACLLDIAHPPSRSSSFGALPDFASRIRGWVRSLPGAALVVDSVQSWWDAHPLRTVGLVAKEASGEIMTPIARRYPYRVVLGAAVVGALLVASRPWRWLLRPALFIGLVPQIASHALRRLPVESWLKMVGDLAGARPTRPGTPRAGGSAKPPGRSL